MNPDLLAQLRDIHVAPQLPWWPPAPGWWILALSVLVMLGWLGRRVLARYRAHQKRRQMLAWIDFLNVMVDPLIEPQAYLSMLNRIFKLIALKKFPGEHCAALSGTEWVEFLSEHFKNKSSVEVLAVLATGPFDPKPEFDPHKMSELARVWIKQHG